MNSPRALATPKEQSILDSQIFQIESRLKGLDETSGRIGDATKRLLNPRPIDVSAAGGEGQAPAPSTVEERMQSIVRHLDALQASFSDHAQTLDQAI